MSDIIYFLWVVLVWGNIGILVLVGVWLHKISNAAKKTNIGEYLDKKNGLEQGGITVLLCVRNGAWDLARNFGRILGQRYAGDWEILVVDDDSGDATADILTDFMRRGRAIARRVRDRSGKRSGCEGEARRSRERPRGAKRRGAEADSPTRSAEGARGTPKNFVLSAKIDTNANLAASKWSLPELRSLRISPKRLAGKKMALAAGVEAAKYGWILVTDVDCWPRSRYWLAECGAMRDERTDFVLGYSPYRREAGILNAWIRFEGLWTWMQYGAMGYWGQPYMGVGRNMLYRRQKFVENYDWRRHGDLISGDDDLLVNALATGANTKLIYSRLSWVYSAPKRDLRGYIRQKSRHLTAGVRYKWRHKLILGFWVQGQVWFWLGGLVLFAVLGGWRLYFLIFLLTLRVLVFGWVAGRAANLFGMRDLGWRLWLFDFVLAWFYLFFAPILAIGTKIRRWN